LREGVDRLLHRDDRAVVEGLAVEDCSATLTAQRIEAGERIIPTLGK
jgi:hypothetical protein